jgi:quercetin dioxygenase-like cupin family protein
VSRPYEVKSVTVVAQAAGLLVREFIFASGESTPWHHHSEVSDRTYVLAGAITLETETGRRVLRAGDSHHLERGIRHRLLNEGEVDARMLLIQDGGRYDFLSDGDPTA